MALTDSQARAAKPSDRPIKLSDGGGLYLLVQPTGSKLWRQAFRFDGKQLTLAHGAYPDVTLGEARRLRDAAKSALKRGVDPRKAEEGDSLPAESLEAITREFVKVRGKRWTGKHQGMILRRFEMFVFDDLGRKPISTISAPAILEALRKIEGKGSLETAKKTRQTLSAIFRYAIATGRAEYDPAHALKDAMQPAPGTKHRLSLPFDKVGQFLHSLSDVEPVIVAAIRLAMHTALRSNELRNARWSDIDGDLLAIPAERMKARSDHVLPLSPQVKAILATLPRDKDSDLILCSPRTGRALDMMTMLSCMYRHGWKDIATLHGFRALFSTQATESGLWSEDAIELSLAHRLPGSGSRRAYNRAKLLDERTRLMQWWSDRLDKAVADHKRNDLSDLLA
ncbi:tyrosine-type recombinase/integrase [Mesorhizobium huakuii]|uniref:Integrase arm-type DNA-binding domain-containing protein n=1 Tax=Mesorhizobium huakuii TaxID=28104 RepID=A0ABZ0VQ55_9HYPH|nr:integrase arm-type DNA-binding domain-containing protein [Mesorhizobium huakuii]WQB99531.1 integrase arm-type DNA-binding domain-containing protein [Mesorhizobium huakuii]